MSKTDNHSFEPTAPGVYQGLRLNSNGGPPS